MTDWNAAFQKWLRQGMPSRQAGKQGRAAGDGGLGGNQRRDLSSAVRDRVCALLREPLEQAAAQTCGVNCKSGQKSNWKKATALSFFWSLTAGQQDELSCLGKALRTDALTPAAAEFLGCRVGGPATTSAPCREPKPPKARLTVKRRSELKVRRLVKTVKNHITRLASTHEEALAVLRRVRRRVDLHFRASTESSWREDASPRLAKALNSFRDGLASGGKSQMLRSFDVALRASGLPRMALQKLGLSISKHAWARAGGQEEGATRKRGRPSKVSDPALIAEVVELVTKNSQPTSIWLHRQGVTARALTTSLLGMYMRSSLLRKVAWKQFFLITRKHAPWLVRGHGKTDYCDHCHLFQKTILPGIVKMVKAVREHLRLILPMYFEPFDKEHGEGLEGKPVELLKAFRQYIFRHDTVHASMRSSLRASQRQALHEKEAGICHRLKHEVNVAESYAWHVNTKDRQLDACLEQKRSLQAGQAMLWMDYKQKFSVPQAGTQTSEMFYGNQRKELTVFGIIVIDFLVTKYDSAISCTSAR